MASGGDGQKKVICEHSSNEVSLATAFVQTLTMASVIWIPLIRAKWPPIVRGEHAGPETSLSPQCCYSNYDDNAFFQDFSKSSHFTQRVWDWTEFKGTPWGVLRFYTKKFAWLYTAFFFIR